MPGEPGARRPHPPAPSPDCAREGENAATRAKSRLLRLLTSWRRPHPRPPLRLRGRRGELAYPIQHRIGGGLDILSPDAEKTNTESLQRGLTVHIAAALFGISVHPAVDFDGEEQLFAIEVDDVGTNGVLAPEFETAEAPISQTIA